MSTLRLAIPLTNGQSPSHFARMNQVVPTFVARGTLPVSALLATDTGRVWAPGSQRACRRGRVPQPDLRSWDRKASCSRGLWAGPTTMSRAETGHGARSAAMDLTEAMNNGEGMRFVSYRGDVVVGGPAQVRELPTLMISKFAVGPLENNVYLLRCRETGEQLLIDAADEAERVQDLIGPEGLATVVTTHRHGDHWQALPAVVDSTSAQTVAHPLDAPQLPVDVNVLVDHGDTVLVGASPLTVIHLRGHTPGSIALLFDDPEGPPHLFTGDSLFPGGPGRTTNPQDFGSLMDDLEERVFEQLPDETWVYPGHGEDLPGIGIERPNLVAWRNAVGEPVRCRTLSKVGREPFVTAMALLSGINRFPSLPLKGVGPAAQNVSLVVTVSANAKRLAGVVRMG